MNKSSLNHSFFQDILRKKVYWICLALITCLSYAFDLVNRTLSIDDLSRPHYGHKDNAMIAGTRWGMTLWNDILSCDEYMPFLDKFWAILFLLLSAVLFSRILFIFFSESKHRLVLCTLFSCLWVSYPLINEIWLYNGANAISFGNASIAAFTILLLYDSRKLFSKKTMISAGLLTIIVSSYESGAFLYVSAVISVLLLDLIIFGKKGWLRKGIIYAIPLVLAVLIRYAIGFGLIKLMNLSYEPNGATKIAWLEGNFTQNLQAVFNLSMHYYFYTGLIYLPVGEFVFASFIGLVCTVVLSVKKRNFHLFLLSIIFYISLFFQPLLQGSFMHYRSALTVHYFTAFTLTMMIFALTFPKKQTYYKIALVFTVYLCYRQGVFLNQTLALNNQRSDNEADLIQNIGYRLKTEFDDKQVIFVGGMDLGDNIERQRRPNQNMIGGYIYRKLAYHFNWGYEDTIIYETDVYPLLNWNIRAFGHQKMMQEYLSYYGYEVETPDELPWYKYENYLYQAKDLNMIPLEIRDTGEYILVYLGDSPW
ncbi:MAG: glucosyltransferase domain-containing protein [Flexilinea sp.]|nr:glucosyltransferase domain-containing protein [Flexilinea sp.]